MDDSYSWGANDIASAFRLRHLLDESTRETSGDGLETTPAMEDDIHSKIDDEAYMDALIELLHASVRGVTVKLMEGKQSTRLVHLGIAGVEEMDLSDAQNPKFWTRTDEPMTRKVAQRLLTTAANSRIARDEWKGIDFVRDPGAALIVLQALSGALQSGKSSVDMELSIFSSLLHSDFQGKNVGALPFVKDLESSTWKHMSSLQEENIPLPHWTKSVLFHCRTIAPVDEVLKGLGHDLKSCSTKIAVDKAYFEILKDETRRCELVGIGCKLSKDNHSDLLLPLLGDDGESLYALVFSARLYKSNLTRVKHWTGFVSTDTRLMYLDQYVDVATASLQNSDTPAPKVRLERAISKLRRQNGGEKSTLNEDIQGLFKGTGRILLHTGLPKGKFRTKRSSSGTDPERVSCPEENWAAALAEDQFVRTVSDATLDKFALTEKCRELIGNVMKKDHS